MKTETAKLEWMQRGKGDKTTTSERMTWETRCRRYRVERHKSTLGDVTRFLAIHVVDGVIGRHYKKTAAMRTCQSHSTER